MASGFWHEKYSPQVHWKFSLQHWHTKTLKLHLEALGLHREWKGESVDFWCCCWHLSLCKDFLSLIISLYFWIILSSFWCILVLRVNKDPSRNQWTAANEKKNNCTWSWVRNWKRNIFVFPHFFFIEDLIYSWHSTGAGIKWWAKQKMAFSPETFPVYWVREEIMK